MMKRLQRIKRTSAKPTPDTWGEGWFFNAFFFAELPKDGYLPEFWCKVCCNEKLILKILLFYLMGISTKVFLSDKVLVMPSSWQPYALEEYLKLDGTGSIRVFCQGCYTNITNVFMRHVGIERMRKMAQDENIRWITLEEEGIV